MSKSEERLAALRRKIPNVKTDPHGARRFAALCFAFYERCENRACRRAGQCVGKTALCFDVFWPGLPEIQKDIYREMVKARFDGAKTPEEIEAVAFAKIMTWYTPQEIYAAAAQAGVQQAQKPVRERVQPRPDREPVLPRARIL
jgi:hypothetical protein